MAKIKDATEALLQKNTTCKFCKSLSKSGIITSNTAEKQCTCVTNISCRSSNVIYCIYNLHYITLHSIREASNTESVVRHFYQRGHNVTFDLEKVSWSTQRNLQRGPAAHQENDPVQQSQQAQHLSFNFGSIKPPQPHTLQDNKDGRTLLTNLDKKPQPFQVAILENCLANDCIRILNGLSFDTDDDQKTVKEILQSDPPFQ